MQLLVEKVADVNAQGGPYEDALQTELAVETRTSGLPRAETYITNRKRPPTIHGHVQLKEGPWSPLNTRVGNSSSQLHQLLFW